MTETEREIKREREWEPESVRGRKIRGAGREIIKGPIEEPGKPREQSGRKLRPPLSVE